MAYYHRSGKGIGSMENLVNPWKTSFLIGFLLALLTTGARAEIITKLPTQEKVVALTFDACETRTPSYFDEKILHFLLEQQIPFTLFVSGKFARRNRDELSKLAQLDFVEIENHSLTHPQHLERLNPDGVKKEVLDNERLLLEITQKKTRFFRFPAGNYDPKTLALVESLGYRVVHWSFASGDPDKKLGSGQAHELGIGKDPARKHSHLSYQRPGLSDRDSPAGDRRDVTGPGLQVRQARGTTVAILKLHCPSG